METGTVSILTSMRSNAALPQVTNLRSVRCARFRGGRLNMHQRPRPPRGHGDLPRTVGAARSVTGREQRSAPGRYEVTLPSMHLSMTYASSCVSGAYRPVLASSIPPGSLPARRGVAGLGTAARAGC